MRVGLGVFLDPVEAVGGELAPDRLGDPQQFTQGVLGQRTRLEEDLEGDRPHARVVALYVTEKVLDTNKITKIRYGNPTLKQ